MHASARSTSTRGATGDRIGSDSPWISARHRGMSERPRFIGPAEIVLFGLMAARRWAASLLAAKPSMHGRTIRDSNAESSAVHGGVFCRIEPNVWEPRSNSAGRGTRTLTLSPAPDFESRDYRQCARMCANLRAPVSLDGSYFGANCHYFSLAVQQQCSTLLMTWSTRRIQRLLDRIDCK